MVKTIVITTRLVQTYLEATGVHVMRDTRATEASVQVSAASANVFMLHSIDMLGSSLPENKPFMSAIFTKNELYMYKDSGFN